MARIVVNHSLKAIAAAFLFISFAACGQEPGKAHAEPLRSVKDRTLVSQALPKATFTVAKGFRLVGTQTVNLYGNAEAEQYLFVKTGPHGLVDRFYWIQFEHFLPTNKLTYNYDQKHTAQLGVIRFVYDVRSWPNFATLIASDPASDGAAITRLLEEHRLSFAERTVMVRMFHLPTDDHRTELMIIYGEALPKHSATPVREGGAQLDTESPASAQIFLGHAKRGLAVQVP